MISEEAIEQTTEFGRGRTLGERRLMLELLEHLDEQGFTVVPADCMLATRDAGQDAGSLPVPRLQLRWEGDSCHYELILRLSEFDIRRETCTDDGPMVRTASEFMAIPLGRTRVTGGDGKHVYEGEVSTPYRDGAHASWDAAQLRLPCYAVCGEHATQVEVKGPASEGCAKTGK